MATVRARYMGQRGIKWPAKAITVPQRHSPLVTAEDCLLPCLLLHHEYCAPGNNNRRPEHTPGLGHICCWTPLRVSSTCTLTTSIPKQVSFSRLFPPNYDLQPHGNTLIKPHRLQSHSPFQACLFCALPFLHMLPHHVCSLW